MTAFTLANLDTQRGFIRDRLALPAGPTSGRPTVPVAGDTRINTDSTNVLEHYDTVSAGWIQNQRNARIVFTAADVFTYAHNFGAYPDVVVLAITVDEDGNEVVEEVEIRVGHEDLNTVTIRFNGTLSGATLLLN